MGNQQPPPSAAAPIVAHIADSLAEAEGMSAGLNACGVLGDRFLLRDRPSEPLLVALKALPRGTPPVVVVIVNVVVGGMWVEVVVVIVECLEASGRQTRRAMKAERVAHVSRNPIARASQVDDVAAI